VHVYIFVSMFYLHPHKNTHNTHTSHTQLLNDILTHLDPSQRRNIRLEGLEAMATRMLEFVYVLGYKQGLDLYVI